MHQQADQTLVVVTHKMSLLSLVQRLVVMAQGRIVLDGPRDAVLEHMRKQAQEAAQKAAAQQQATPAAVEGVTANGGTPNPQGA